MKVADHGSGICDECERNALKVIYIETITAQGDPENGGYMYLCEECCQKLSAKLRNLAVID